MYIPTQLRKKKREEMYSRQTEAGLHKEHFFIHILDMIFVEKTLK
jgi:hypothetical protein